MSTDDRPRPVIWINKHIATRSVFTLLSVIDLEELPATFTTGQARAAGVHPRNLYRWRDEGSVVVLSRGVFRRADAPEPSHPELLGVSFRAPRAVVCLVSAAALHDLTDELPRAAQIAVPQGTRAPRITYPPVEVFHFDATTFDLGVELMDAVDGEAVRVYSPARTVVDLMRLRRRIGEPLALGALRRHLRQQGAKPALLLQLSRALGVLGPVRSAVDVLESS